jgi:hypothetical protein
VNGAHLHRPIFIAGGGRSGTTLLRSLLSAHSRISVSPETHFMQRARQWGLLEKEGPADFDLFWKRYVASVRFRDLGIDPNSCRKVIQQAGTPTFRTIFAAVLAAYGERVGKERIGEKTPGHVHFIPQLLSWFPDARILVLRRDPRAVVASQMRSPWVKERITPVSFRKGIVVGSYWHQVAFYAEDWSSMYEEVVPAEIEDPRVLLVPYEELVQDAERELLKICDFIEERFESNMLDGRSNDNVPIPASTADLNDTAWREWRKEHHAKTLQPVSTGSLDKWKNQLTEKEVAMVEGHCVRGMQAAGYSPTLSASRRRAGRTAVKALLSIENAESNIRTLVETAGTFGKRVIRRLRRVLSQSR